jgi:hypothetical protein
VQCVGWYLCQVLIHGLASGQAASIKAVQHAPAARVRAGLLQVAAYTASEQTLQSKNSSASSPASHSGIDTTRCTRLATLIWNNHPGRGASL